ncbi:MAG: hypothetical protein ACRESU_07370, partial [Gammaproteobacteria bacterium]
IRSTLRSPIEFIHGLTGQYWFAQGKDLEGGGESPRQFTRRSRSKTPPHPNLLPRGEKGQEKSGRRPRFIKTWIPAIPGNCSCISGTSAFLAVAQNDEGVAFGRSIKIWIPACAGMTIERGKAAHYHSSTSTLRIYAQSERDIYHPSP